ncbi:MAG: T9SS type A sorting domain-containing protein [Bacteroidota bacterium]
MKNQLLIYSMVLLLSSTASLQAQWTSLGNNIIPSNHRVWSLKIAPDKSVWAVSSFDNSPPLNNYPEVHRSTDAGKTWETTQLPAGFSTYGWDISPIDSNIAYVALDSSGLYKTIDGGQNWNKVTSYPYLAVAVHFFNSQEGLVLGADNFITIGVTTNGGNTWTHMGGANWVQPSGTSIPPINRNSRPYFSYSISSFYDVKGEVIIFGNTTGEYWISTDKGYNWESKETPLKDIGLRLSNVAIKDDSTFMVAGDILDATGDGVATVNYTTQDAGNTWIRGNSTLTCGATHYIPGSDSVFVMMGHNNFGWGREGTAISYDYGATWEKLDATRALAMDFADDSTGYAACCDNIWPTANGQIFKWNLDLNPPTSIVDESQIDLLKIFPNPANEAVQLELPSGLIGKSIAVQVLDVHGRTLKQESKFTTQKKLKLDVQGLTSGRYHVVIQGDRAYMRGSFIKK